MNTDGGGNLDADPLFVDASNPGGPDGTFGTADDGLRLAGGSPAIDAGDNAAVPSGVTTDLAGADRIQSGTVDLGAYEGAATSPASIGDFVFEDTNANGLQETGEPGIDDVTVELLDCNETVLDTATTAGGGAYAFTNLAAGCYKARFTGLPSGFAFTLQDEGTPDDDGIDSDADPDTGTTGEITLAAGAENLDVDVGLLAIGECTATVLTEGDLYAEGGLGRIDLTFENPDGLAKIAFTNFENFTLVAGSVDPQPDGTGTTSVGGPLLTFASGPDFDGAPQAVTLTLEQADADVSTSTYFAVASSVCPNPEQDEDGDGLLDTDFDPPVGFEAVVPAALTIEAPYPNPLAAGSAATFRVGLPESDRVTLAIYDVMGRRVATVTDRALAAGTHDLRWDGRSQSGGPVASGLYLARLTAGSTTQVHRLTVVR